MSRVLTTAELGYAARDWRREGAVIVLCAGVFDPLHLGHVRHLEAARAMGNVLVVSVASDKLVRAKRQGRPDLPAPLMPAEQRVGVVAALKFVDAAVICEDADASAIIAVLRPHVFAKGEEYRDRITPALDAEGRALDRVGGRLEFVSGPVVFSSSAILAGV